MSDFGHKIENPLFLFSLFEKGVYCIDADVELLNSLNTKSLNSVSTGDETVSTSNQIAPNSSQENTKNAISTPEEIDVTHNTDSINSLSNTTENDIKVAENLEKVQPVTVEIKQSVQILNLFFDTADNPMQSMAMEAYPKLMQAIKLNGDNLQSTDFAMIGLHQSAIMKSLISENTIGLLPEIWKEFNVKYVLVWTNRRLTNPNLEHFKMIEYQGVSLILLPSFSTMIANVELKKRVWVNLKNLLGFV